jgi:hypothetical protein
MNFDQAYIETTSFVAEPKFESNITDNNKTVTIGITPLISEEEQSLEEIYNMELTKYQQNLNSAMNELNQANNKILNLESSLNTMKMKQASSSTSKPVLEQVCKINTNKKWYITILISIIILFFTSTYSVNFIDNWLDNHGVDLFSTSDRMNELLLLVIQFIFIVIIVRLILQLV